MVFVSPMFLLVAKSMFLLLNLADTATKISWSTCFGVAVVGGWLCFLLTKARVDNDLDPFFIKNNWSLGTTAAIKGHRYRY